LKHRLKKLEQGRGKKVATFVLHQGTASGAANWNNLSWQDLTARELDHLVAQLEGEGVEVAVIKVEPVEP